MLRPGVEVHQVRPDGTVEHTGGTSTADVVVGADGLHSAVRRSLWPDAPAPRYAGYTTFRMIAAARPVEGSVESWGQGDRFGYAPLADGRVYCYAMVTAPQHGTGGLADLRRRFAGWHNPIPALLETVEPDAVLRHDTYEMIARRSRQLGAMANPTGPQVAAARDAALRMAPASVFVRSMHPVVGWTG